MMEVPYTHQEDLDASIAAGVRAWPVLTHDRFPPP